ncbi:MAG: AGE family epimerase/isomerase [Chitinophagaceae bacterium]
MTSLATKPEEWTFVQYRKEVTDELHSILSYWKKYAVDQEQGGFYGSVNNNNIADLTAPKGIVLNSRILWAFSAAYPFTRDESHLQVATRAYTYILDHFIDRQYGGVFWSVDAHGYLLEGRKQIYGLAFCLYGMSEYYKVTKEESVLFEAKKLYDLIEKYSHDKERGGYIEAFTREWKQLDDLRLSAKDDNEKKTMNTHLHVIEAYANLYRAWPEQKLKERIIGLLEIFNRYIINNSTGHLNLFLDENWSLRSTIQSYGHDIEGAWLLQECAEITGNKLYIDYFKKMAVKLTNAAAEGLDKDGGLWYEYEPASNHLIKEKHSWPQAEAMIGFFNAWQITGEKKYLDYSLNSWEFVKQHICDRKNGEWFWGVYEDYSLMEKDKAGFWKCPYHSSRACLEIIRRIG